jgi:hypothetical protein
VKSVGSAVSKAAVMLVRAFVGTTSISAPSRVNPTAMLDSMLRHQDGASEDRAAADRHGRQQQQRARPAPSEILQRDAGQQKPDA